LSNVRIALSDTVATYRWSDGVLSTYIQDGIANIKQKRADAISPDGSVRDGFATALYFYALARAYDDDAGLTPNNKSLSQSYDAQYQNELEIALYFYTDTNISTSIAAAISTVKSKRIDANYAYDGTVLAISTIRDSFADAVYFYALSDIYSKDNPALSQSYEKEFYDNLGTVLYFYPETVLLDGINNGIQAVFRDRPDAYLTDTGLLRDSEITVVVDGIIDLPIIVKNAIINFTAYEGVLAVKEDAKLATLFLSIYNKEVGK